MVPYAAASCGMRDASARDSGSDAKNAVPPHWEWTCPFPTSQTSLRLFIEHWEIKFSMK
jgi:hypothetical protein